MRFTLSPDVGTVPLGQRQGLLRSYVSGYRGQHEGPNDLKP